MEVEALAAINTERAGEDVPALTMHEPLRAVARAHSEDMLARDFFAHNNPEGESPFDRMDAAGIEYGTAGENIAWNNFPDPVETAVTGWMNSPGHRNNILNGAFTETGLGIAGNDADGYYFTQAFMGPGGKVLLWSEELETFPAPLAEPKRY